MLVKVRSCESILFWRHFRFIILWNIWNTCLQSTDSMIYSTSNALLLTHFISVAIGMLNLKKVKNRPMILIGG